MLRRHLSPMALALALAAALATTPAVADNGPPVRLVVPFAPGGGSDLVARAIATPLAAQLGRTVVVENKPGGGATMGADLVAKSAPDGLTLLYATPGPQIDLLDAVGGGGRGQAPSVSSTVAGPSSGGTRQPGLTASSWNITQRQRLAKPASVTRVSSRQVCTASWRANSQRFAGSPRSQSTPRWN